MRGGYVIVSRGVGRNAVTLGCIDFTPYSFDNPKIFGSDAGDWPRAFEGNKGSILGEWTRYNQLQGRTEHEEG